MRPPTSKDGGSRPAEAICIVDAWSSTGSSHEEGSGSGADVIGHDVVDQVLLKTFVSDDCLQRYTVLVVCSKTKSIPTSSTPSSSRQMSMVSSRPVELCAFQSICGCR